MVQLLSAPKRSSRPTKFRPDVLILDVHMPLEPGLSHSDLGVQLNSCGTKVLGISFAYDDDARALATNMGAVELLDKVMLGQELLPAIMRLGFSEKVSPSSGTHPVKQ